MHLLVGLGNIGVDYELTRHNFGFLLLDQIIEDYGFLSQSKKFKSEVFTGEIAGEKIVALKPHTFMNRSGVAVIEAANFYKIHPANIIVFHDDLDLELGRVKVKIGGGNAGHNGLKSLDEMLGKEYVRLRLGIGRPIHAGFETADYVLGKFTKDELMAVEKVNQKISDLFDYIIEGRVDEFLNNFYLKRI